MQQKCGWIVATFAGRGKVYDGETDCSRNKRKGNETTFFAANDGFILSFYCGIFWGRECNLIPYGTVDRHLNGWRV